MPSGVVRRSNTTSGGASMSIDVACSVTTALRAVFGCGLEGGELLRPELVEVRAHDGQAVGADREQVAGPVARAGHQTCVAQDAEVVRRGLLGEAELVSHLPDRARPRSDQRQDPPPVRIGQGPQGPVQPVVVQGLGTHGSTPYHKLSFVLMTICACRLALIEGGQQVDNSRTKGGPCPLQSRSDSSCWPAAWDHGCGRGRRPSLSPAWLGRASSSGRWRLRTMPASSRSSSSPATAPPRSTGTSSTSLG